MYHQPPASVSGVQNSVQRLIARSASALNGSSRLMKKIARNAAMIPAMASASGVRNASCGRYIGLVKPANRVWSVSQLPGSIMKPRIETMIAIVIHENAASAKPSRMWRRLACGVVHVFQVRK